MKLRELQDLPVQIKKLGFESYCLFLTQKEIDDLKEDIELFTWDKKSFSLPKFPNEMAKFEGYAFSVNNNLGTHLDIHLFVNDAPKSEEVDLLSNLSSFVNQRLFSLKHEYEAIKNVVGMFDTEMGEKRKTEILSQWCLLKEISDFIIRLKNPSQTTIIGKVESTTKLPIELTD